ncbi:MAG: 50S ribosomal protein L4 [Oscillospiraceae bacterium]|jgi:large subunit ribosomal protein L4|nr:50S ribosomal protein L4 [Oscillospiraceae bacterium]
MPKSSVVNMSGDIVGEIELSDSIFGIEPNLAVLHESIVAYQINQRQGNKSTLTRAEVSGGGRKPWRQKGTGHARQGSTRAPHWRHGGVVFAPKPREFSVNLNKKVRKLAMRSALSLKAKNCEIVVFDDILLENYKTKVIYNMLESVNAVKKSFIILHKLNRFVIRSSSNIPGVTTSQVQDLCAYCVFYGGKLLITKQAVAQIGEMCA